MTNQRALAGKMAVAVWLIAFSPHAPHADAQSTVIPSREAGYPIVGLEEFRRVVDSGSSMIVDARPEDEYAAGHVPGSVNVPRYKVVTNLAEVESKLPKERLLTLYCGGPDCQDADMEARALIKLGYSRVSVFRGGIKEWREHQWPEERSSLPGGNTN